MPGIFDGDLLVVDRAIAPQADDIVIAVLHGELTVKRLRKSNGALILYAENPDFPDIALDDAGCEAWGVVRRPAASTSSSNAPASSFDTQMRIRLIEPAEFADVGVTVPCQPISLARPLIVVMIDARRHVSLLSLRGEWSEQPSKTKDTQPRLTIAVQLIKTDG